MASRDRDLFGQKYRHLNLDELDSVKSLTSGGKSISSQLYDLSSQSSPSDAGPMKRKATEPMKRTSTEVIQGSQSPKPKPSKPTNTNEEIMLEEESMETSIPEDSEDPMVFEASLAVPNGTDGNAFAVQGVKVPVHSDNGFHGMMQLSPLSSQQKPSRSPSPLARRAEPAKTEVLRHALSSFSMSPGNPSQSDISTQDPAIAAQELQLDEDITEKPKRRKKRSAQSAEDLRTTPVKKKTKGCKTMQTEEYATRHSPKPQSPRQFSFNSSPQSQPKPIHIAANKPKGKGKSKKRGKKTSDSLLLPPASPMSVPSDLSANASAGINAGFGFLQGFQGFLAQQPPLKTLTPPLHPGAKAPDEETKRQVETDEMEGCSKPTEISADAQDTDKAQNKKKGSKRPRSANDNLDTEESESNDSNAVNANAAHGAPAANGQAGDTIAARVTKRRRLKAGS